MKKHNLDYLILYEHKEREIENACYLSLALKKRGYSVKIACIYSLYRFRYRPKVLIVPHLYDDKQVFDFITKYGNRRCSVVNLQYEQILSENDEKWNYSIPKGQARKCVIFAWGDSEERRCRLAKQQSIRVGNIACDFDRKEFENYFKSKDNLKMKYNIKTKKILLFISSFSLVNYTDETIEKMFHGNVEATKQLRNISISSQKYILEWLSEIAKEFKDNTVIYRPHPAEDKSKQLTVFLQANPNIKMIKDYSVRQWITVADKIYTWYSTSLFDVFYAEKNCGIIRPIEIPKEADICAMHYAKMIKTLEEFKDDIKSKEDGMFPIPSNLIISEFGSKDFKIAKYVESLMKIYNNDLYYENWKKDRSMSIGYMIGTFGRGVLFDLSRYMDISLIYRIMLRRRPEVLNNALKSQNELYKIGFLIKDSTKRLEKIDLSQAGI